MATATGGERTPRDDRPLVSIVIPVHDKAPFVTETLESCIAQTYAPMEIVVVDDGSSDDSADLARAALGGRGEVLTIANGGVSNARNVGASRATAGAQFLLFLDADDVLERGALEEMVSALQQHPEWVACYSAPRFVDATGAELPDERMPVRWAPTRFGRRRIEEEDSWTPLAAIWSNFFVIPSSCLIRRDAFERTTGWDSTLCRPANPFHAEDKDMVIQLALLGDVGRVRGPLLRYRVLPSGHRDALYAGLSALNEKWWGLPRSDARRRRVRAAIRFEARVRLFDSAGACRRAFASRRAGEIGSATRGVARSLVRFVMVHLPLSRLPDRRRSRRR